MAQDTQGDAAAGPQSLYSEYLTRLSGLAAPEGSMLELGEFRRLVRQALTALSRFGVLQDDTKLDNSHPTDGRAVEFDFP